MRDLQGPYASYFNARHGLCGRLWQGRFHSTVMDEEHFWQGLRYVERNPVRAGIVDRAEAYAWSSAAAHCRLSQDPLLAPLPTLPGYIGSWLDWIGAQEDRQHLRIIRRNTKTGCPCGGDPFIEELERILGVSLKRRPRGRPRGASRSDNKLPFPD